MILWIAERDSNFKFIPKKELTMGQLRLLKVEGSLDPDKEAPPLLRNITSHSNRFKYKRMRKAAWEEAVEKKRATRLKNSKAGMERSRGVEKEKPNLWANREDIWFNRGLFIPPLPTDGKPQEK